VTGYQIKLLPLNSYEEGITPIYKAHKYFSGVNITLNIVAEVLRCFYITWTMDSNFFRGMDICTHELLVFMFLLYYVCRASFWADLFPKESYQVYIKIRFRKPKQPNALSRFGL